MLLVKFTNYRLSIELFLSLSTKRERESARFDLAIKIEISYPHEAVSESIHNNTTRDKILITLRPWVQDLHTHSSQAPHGKLEMEGRGKKKEEKRGIHSFTLFKEDTSENRFWVTSDFALPKNTESAEPDCDICITCGEKRSKNK
ncbi:hypothetical protein CEXT_257061 [Caerostris extrusa]|uniref:Uncharacterized protein n=1 Tax=Caerostris extrusa TaxID=172846 RepID=A0AAV4W1L3_CAEEX|nr:hypothetical protein CEXT_257061 [Caerostris extrusa]